MYCVDVMGIDHVTFGPDTIYGDHVAMHHVFAKFLHRGVGRDGGPDKDLSGREFERVPYVEGLESPTESFHNIVGWLVKHEWSDEDIATVVGGNTLRALRDIWVA
jgi:membrane dipeptidase